MFLLVLVALGGALGSLIRYSLSQYFTFSIGYFPLINIIINILASMVVGFFAALFRSNISHPLADKIMSFIGYGFCGGFTTFSSFSLQNFKFIQSGQFWWAIFNIVLTIGLSLIALAIAYYLGQKYIKIFI